MHPISAANKYFFVAAISKIDNAAVLQKATHNVSDADCLRHSLEPRTQHTNAPHDQFHWHAGPRGLVQFRDQTLVRQSVYLGDDARGTARFPMTDLTIDKLGHALSHIHGRHDEPA